MEGVQRITERRKAADEDTVIAGFFTGGSLAIRGGMKAARNSAIGCAILLAVIEGVGIGIQRMMAENTRLDVCLPPFIHFSTLVLELRPTACQSLTANVMASKVPPPPPPPPAVEGTQTPMLA